MTSARPYLAVLSLTTAAAILLSAGMVWLADPFGIWAADSGKMTPAMKQARHDYLRKVQSIELARVAPRGVILGSSRTYFLPVEQNIWPVQPVYNFWSSGADTIEVMKKFRYALAVAPVDTVVVGLDYFQFTPDRLPAEAYDPQLFEPPVIRRLAAFSSLVRTLVSWDALKISFSSYFREVTERPKRTIEVGDFPAVDHLYICTIWAAARAHVNVKYDRRALLNLREILTNARNNKRIKLMLYLPPIHARFHSALVEVGLWENYFAWKREVFRLVLDAGMAERVSLWDFSYVHQTSQWEPEIDMDFDDPKALYVESSHFNFTVGRYILRSLFNRERASVPEDFGRRITSIPGPADRLAELALVQAWRKQHPETVADLAAKVDRCEGLQ